MKLMERARELAAGTPPHRNRYVDFLRAVSISVVVLGHWLIAVFTVQEERLVAGHLLAERPWTQALTWVFQVMPVFFMVGGFSNGASWSATLKAGGSYADWLRSRCRRLLGPTAIFALVWVPVALFARLFVADEELLVLGARLVTVPLWFLAVYLMVIPAAPAMHWLHRRLGLAVPVVLTAAAAAIDFLDRATYVKGEAFQLSFGWVNFALVWLAIHQIGFFWQEGRIDENSRSRWFLAGVGLAGMVSLTFSGLYPFSMLGVPGNRTNNTPPTVVLIFLALFQFGVILISSPWARKLLARTEPWARTIVANGMIMTMYLWHLTAMILVVFAGYTLGLRFDIEPLGGMWWLSRLAWLALLAVVLTGFVAVFGRFERPRPANAVGGGIGWGILSCFGALLAGAGLASLAMEGFYTPNDYWGIPVGTLLALLLGAAAVGVTPRIYGRS